MTARDAFRLASVDIVPLAARSAARQWIIVCGVALFLAGAAWCVYGRAIRAPLIFDDVNAIEKNISIRRLWPLVGSAAAPGPLRPPRQTSVAGRPLANLSLAVNYRWGEVEPVGYHCVNLALNVLAATLLWAIVRRMLLLDYFQRRYERSADWLALGTALVWALHPLQTDAVQYIVQRTELMMGCCYLATFYASLRYWQATQRPARCTWVLAAWTACALGMGCKESMVTAPLVVLSAERTFLTGSFRSALRRSAPLYLGLAASWAILFALNRHGPRSASAGFQAGLPAHVWWMTQAEVLWIYLKLVAWPWPLVIHYELPYRETLGSAWPWLLATALLIIASLWLFWRRTASGFLAVTVLVLLAPTLIVPITSETAAERRMYLPLAAIAAGGIGGGYALLSSLSRRRARIESTHAQNKMPLVALATVVVLVVGTLGVVSARRVEIYNDPVALWQDAARHQPQNARTQKNLALELVNAGRPTEALEHYANSLRLQPYDAEAENNLGVALVRLDRPREAIKHFEQAIALEPDYVPAHVNLGHAYSNLGTLDEAIAHYQRALDLDPRQTAVRVNLGHALTAFSRYDDAMSQFQTAVDDDPTSVQALASLAAALAIDGRFGEAIEYRQQVVQLKPDDPESHLGLAGVYAQAGDSVQAIAAYEKAIELARQQQRTALADEIDAWLSEYRRQIATP